MIRGGARGESHSPGTCPYDRHPGQGRGLLRSNDGLEFAADERELDLELHDHLPHVLRGLQVATEDTWGTYDGLVCKDIVVVCYGLVDLLLHT